MKVVVRLIVVAIWPIIALTKTDREGSSYLF